MANRVQIIKGFLEGFVLKVLEDENLFTNEIIQKLSSLGYEGLSEGTLYPLMLRLDDQQFITYEKVYNALGPARKKYAITPLGIQELRNIEQIWSDFKKVADHILGG